MSTANLSRPGQDPPKSLELVQDPRRARLLMHPLRQRILEVTRERPMSAAEAARHLGLARQKVNYHMGELAEGGFLEEVEELRRGNLMERRYRATARGWILAPEILGPLAPAGPSTEDALSAAHLLALSARIQTELGRALREAGRRKQRISTLSVDTELRFESAEQRAVFAGALEDAALEVVARHASPWVEGDGTPAPGRPYRLVIGCHPIPEGVGAPSTRSEEAEDE